MSKSSKKMRDKWRMKKWYTVSTPSYFGEIDLAFIPAKDSDQIHGRVVDTTLYDITNDFSHQSIKLFFLITSVHGQRATTVLKGHEYSSDFLRSLVRRGSNRVDGIFNVTTKDGFKTRASIVTFTRGKINGSQEKAIRQVMNDIIEQKAKDLSYDQLCHEMVLGKIGSDIFNETKKIAPLRHAGVRKSKLLSIPITAPEKLEEPKSTEQATVEVKAEASSS
ncbi:30S ribosomal protein S3ae [[Eubacterium] cellulosolvens]